MDHGRKSREHLFSVDQHGLMELHPASTVRVNRGTVGGDALALVKRVEVLNAFAGEAKADVTIQVERER